MITTRSLLAAKAATGAGTAIVLGSRTTSPVGTKDMDASVAMSDTGSATQITVSIEGSNDNGVTWSTIVTHDYTLAGANVALPNVHFKQLRANLLTLTGGTSPDVTADITYDEEKG